MFENPKNILEVFPQNLTLKFEYSDDLIVTRSGLTNFNNVCEPRGLRMTFRARHFYL